MPSINHLCTNGDLEDKDLMFNNPQFTEIFFSFSCLGADTVALHDQQENNLLPRLDFA